MIDGYIIICVLFKWFTIILFLHLLHFYTFTPFIPLNVSITEKIKHNYDK